MKTLLILSCLCLCSCGIVNSVADTASGILGVESPSQNDANALQSPIIRNEYHAACERRKQEAILDILGEGKP